MTPKEIGRQAGRIFESILPSNFIYRSQEDQEDYGIDGEIEITEKKDMPTGLLFKVQIKGQKNGAYIQDGEFLTQILKTARLNYYINHIELPVILIAVDVKQKYIFWKSLQDDSEIRSKLSLALKNKQESVTIRIPTSNKVESNLNAILSAVNRNSDWLRLNAVRKLGIYTDDLLSKTSSNEVEELLRTSKKAMFHLWNAKFENLLIENDDEALAEESSTVLQSETESIETRFCAASYLESSLTKLIGVKDPSLENTLFSIFKYLLLDVARVKGCPIRLRRYASLLLRSIRLRIFVDQDYHNFITRKIAENDDMVAMIGLFANNNTAIKASKEVTKTIFELNKLITDDLIFLIPEMIPRTFYRFNIFLERMKQERLDTDVERLRAWMKAYLSIGMQITEMVDEDFHRVQLTIIQFVISEDKDEALIECQKMAENISTPQMKTHLLAKLQSQYSIHSNPELPQSPECEIEFFKQRALSLGFNINDPDDEMGRIIKQGIEDYNPERVLKDCKNLLIVPSLALGFPARAVGIPTATHKWIHCLKHQHSVAGWSLDQTYSGEPKQFSYKEKYCSNCSDHSPRASDWKWNREWQRKEMNKHDDIVKALQNSF